LEAEEDVNAKSVQTPEELWQEKRTDPTTSHCQEDSDDKPLVNFDLLPVFSQYFQHTFLVDNYVLGLQSTWKVSTGERV